MSNKPSKIIRHVKKQKNVTHNLEKSSMKTDNTDVEIGRQGL